MEIDILVATLAFFAAGFLTGAIFGAAAGRCIEKDRVYDPLRKIVLEAADSLSDGERYAVILQLNISREEDGGNTSAAKSLATNLYQNWMYQ